MCQSTDGMSADLISTCTHSLPCRDTHFLHIFSSHSSYRPLPHTRLLLLFHAVQATETSYGVVHEHLVIPNSLAHSCRR